MTGYNNIVIEGINPNRRNEDKYSLNLYKFLKHPDNEQFLLYGKIYKNKDNDLWLGCLDEEDGFIGCKLIQILCTGRRDDIKWYQVKDLNNIKEVKNFWKQYIKYGRCVIDTNHDMYFINDEKRWDIVKNKRFCNWCKKVVQKKVRTKVVIYKENWVNIRKG